MVTNPATNQVKRAQHSPINPAEQMVLRGETSITRPNGLIKG